MTEPSTKHDELLFSSIDGELNPQQAAELEALLNADPELQKRLDTLKAMNASLVRIASEPAEPDPLKFEQAPQTKPNPLRWIAYAAILAISAGLFIYMNPSQPKPVFDTRNVYRQITMEFEPQIVCDTPEKFIAYTQEAFGNLIEADFQSSVQLVGWRLLGANYTPNKPPKVPTTRILLANSEDGTQILVAFVPRGLPIPKPQQGSNLNVFEKSVRSVRMYEITPLDSPSVLELLN
ncbi:MAG: hypothetical protein RLN78_01915 [Phycisphaerales bacterium]